MQGEHTTSPQGGQAKPGSELSAPVKRVRAIQRECEKGIAAPGRRGIVEPKVDLPLRPPYRWRRGQG